MTRDEIYEHLAQVYLGKKNTIEKKEKKRQFNAWLAINIVVTIIIFGSSFYAFSAFLIHRDSLRNKIIYSLTNGPIRIKYNLTYPHPPVESFSLSIPQISIVKYQNLQFSIRGMDEGYPGIVKVEIRNKRNEISSVLLEGVNLDWKNFVISFDEFPQISDWSTIEEISFIFESWNAEKKEGIVLIDDICFSS